VKTATITYYGEGPLNLQIRRFKNGSSVKARLDDILPDERRRYADRFLVVGPDGLIINIGSMVPDSVAKEVIGTNPQVLKVPGFDVRIPPGFAMDESGAEPVIVEAAVMAAKKETATAVVEPPETGVEVETVAVHADGEEIVVETKVTPPMPAEEVVVEPHVEVEEAEVTTVVTEPDLTDKKPEKAAKKKAPKKKAAKRKPAKNRKGRGGKKKADDLMEMF
jgi:hypothetical protein